MINVKTDLIKMTDEQLDELEKVIKAEKQTRKETKRTNLFTALEKAWKDVEAEGIKIWISGNGWTSEEDFPIDFEDIYFS